MPIEGRSFSLVDSNEREINTVFADAEFAHHGFVKGRRQPQVVSDAYFMHLSQTGFLIDLGNYVVHSPMESVAVDDMQKSAESDVHQRTENHAAPDKKTAEGRQRVQGASFFFNKQVLSMLHVCHGH